MPFELNKKMKSIEPYEPITGSYRIRLDANESFIPPADEVMNDIKAAIDALHFNRYPDPAASELCALAADYYGVKPEQVVAGNGSDDLISVCMNAFTQRDDKILTFTPDFSMYSFYSGLIETSCIAMPKRDDFTIDVDSAIKTANSENVRLIIFSNPCNPTSILLGADEVRKIVRSVNALVIVDEAYMDFADRSVVKETEDYDNLIVLRTLSKAMGMASVRLGLAITNKTLAGLIRTAKSPYNVNSVSQAIGCAVFSHKDYIQHSVTRINSSRDMLFAEFKRLQTELPGKIFPVAADANFVYTKAADASALFEALKNSGIIVRRFGDYLRVTAGRNLENIEVVSAIERFYKGT